MDPKCAGYQEGGRQLSRSLETSGSTFSQTARQSHSDCVICGTDDPLGLGLEFQAGTDGSMSVIVGNGSRFRGYPNRLHGGIISVLFDAAMTHCLFAQGVTGVTASLNINFRKPVIPHRSITVHAQVVKQKSDLYVLKGSLQQDGEVKCTAEAKFWHVPHSEQHVE